MVGRFRPLDVKLDFQDQVYRLGETIALRVELKAGRRGVEGGSGGPDVRGALD